MKKRRIFGTILALAVLAAGVGAYYFFVAKKDAPTPASAEEAAAVRAVVAGFGSRLQLVSLTAPAELATEAIQQYYTPYVSAALLARWKNNPAAAPGRAVSSPWPDRIEISSAVKRGEEFYEVTGRVVERTSDDAAVAAYQVSVEVGWDHERGQWLITAFEAGPYE